RENPPLRTLLPYTPRFRSGAARAGIERPLVRRDVEAGGVGLERGLRAVAVMHVEIDHGDTLATVNRAGVERPNGDVVEEAEAHGRLRLGMMSRRADGAETVARPARHHLVHGMDDSARRTVGGLKGARRHGGVGVDAAEAGFGHRALD